MEDAKDYNFFIVRLVVDAIIIYASWILSYAIRFKLIPGGEPFLARFFTILGIPIVCIFILYLNKNKLYVSMRYISWIDETQKVIYASFQSIVFIIVVLYFSIPRISRLTLMIFFTVVTVALVLERTVIKNMLVRIRMHGRNIKKVLLVGFGENLNSYIHAMESIEGSGFHIVGQVDCQKHPIEGITQYNDSVDKVIHKTKPHIIIIGYPGEYYETLQKQLGYCNELLQSVFIIPEIPLSLIGTKITSFNQFPLLKINHVKLSNFDKFLKRVTGLLLSSVGVVVLSPLFCIIAGLIKITSRGPVFYYQERVTENGKIFRMIKFRSMKADCNSSELKFTQKDDDRCTSIGKFLRKTSIDELPQLFNVIKGDMSLIGPRPERPEFVQKFEKEIPGYTLRHKVKAGMSGWAQVNGWRGDTSLIHRLECDLYYIQNWSILFDLKIMFLTFWKGFINKNAY